MEKTILKYGPTVIPIVAILLVAYAIGTSAADWRWKELERTAAEKRLREENQELLHKLQTRIIIDSAR